MSILDDDGQDALTDAYLIDRAEHDAHAEGNEPDEDDDTIPEVEPEAPHPGYIRLQIDMNYDARSHGKFVKAPDNWADMDEVARRTFLEDEAERYRDEEISAHGTYYATADEAREASAESRGWGVDFDEDDVEEIY